MNVKETKKNIIQAGQRAVDELIKVAKEPIVDSEDDKILIKIVKKHLEETNSSLAKKMLSDWSNHISKFKKITPRDYEKALIKLNRKHEVFIN